jgi:nicotinate phosphoribosyltransferase
VSEPDKQLGLYTDLYEVRMAESYFARGMTGEATFSLYIRPTPERPWFVALGVDRVLAFLDDFTYGDDELAYLRSVGVGEPAIDGLRDLELRGEICAVPDGTVVLAGEPILEFTGPLPVGQLIETAVINLVQLSTLVATKAARTVLAAQGRPLVEFGFRRAQGLETGIEASRAAYLAGVWSTSNLEAGRRYGIPVVGTMAHAFVQAFSGSGGTPEPPADELTAFRAFAEDHPDGCVLLVDTYDVAQGVRNAIVVGEELRARGKELRGIRLDSGDLAALARTARRLLDDAGLRDVTIFASGGLDECDIARLIEAAAPIDAFGVGTDLVTSSDRPALDISYKLVAYEGRGVVKLSAGKRTLPGAKQVFRSGSPERDVLALRDERLDGDPLLRPVWRDGSVLDPTDLGTIRRRIATQLAALPSAWTDVLDPIGPQGPQVSERLSLASRSASAGPEPGQRRSRSEP